ncbi:MAG: hypothetical protein D6820_10065, partial [Lentisphaerae bacterium]
HYAAAYLAKKQKSAAEHIPLIGYDLIEENVDGLRKGLIDYIISTRSEEQGALAIQILFKKVVLRQLEERVDITMPLDIVCKYNVDSIVNFKFTHFS